MRKHLVFFLFLLFATGTISLSVSAKEGEKFIQGTWRLTGELPKDKNGHSMSWFLEWTFSNGTFLQTGYPPLKQEGKYRIIKNEKEKLTLELYEQTGTFGSENKQIEILIDKKKQRLKIQDKEGFERVENKKQNSD